MPPKTVNITKRETTRHDESLHVNIQYQLWGYFTKQIHKSQASKL